MEILRLSPALLLILLSTMNLLIYIDRGAIGSNGVNGRQASDAGPGSGIQGDFGISNAMDGFLPGAFMVGLLVSSPVFAECSKHYNAFRLIAMGLGIWTLACAACGLATGFGFLVFCRMFVGVGEASFVALAAPFIDDNAPPASKTRWLAIFYSCIPTGYALGYIFGGLVAVRLGWRGPFFLEALAMVPFVLYCSFAPPLDIKGTKADGRSKREPESGKLQHAVAAFGSDLLILLRHPVYVLAVLASTVYTGVIGMYSYLGPKAGAQVFKIPGQTADLSFGGITVLTGILGALGGGVLLDKIGAGTRNACMICSACMFIGAVACGGGFLFTPTLRVFLPVFGVGELAVFAIQAPSNAITLWSVPPSLRPFAVSISIVITHIFGDVPSPTVVGWIQDRLHNWRHSMTIGTAFFFLSSILFAISYLASRSNPDYRKAAEERLSSADEVESMLVDDQHCLSASSDELQP